MNRRILTAAAIFHALSSNMVLAVKAEPTKQVQERAANIYHKKKVKAFTILKMMATKGATLSPLAGRIEGGYNIGIPTRT